LQESHALAHSPRTVFRAQGAAGVSLLLVAEALVPRDRGGVLVMEHHGPILPGHSAGVARHPGRFAGEAAGPGLGPAINVRPGLGGMRQHLEDARVRQGGPVARVALAFPPPARGETEVMDGEVLHDGQRCSGLGTEGAEESDSLVHCLIRSKDHLSGRLEHDPGRGPETQGAVLYLFQRAAQEPVAQPVQLGFAPGALAAQQ
jgi:hypothetical protein